MPQYSLVARGLHLNYFLFNRVLMLSSYFLKTAGGPQVARGPCIEPPDLNVSCTNTQETAFQKVCVYTYK
jgi:hypothetical protein